MPTMEALRYHTYDGAAYDEGDRYEADPAYVETLEAVGFAKVAAVPTTPVPHGPTHDEAKHPTTHRKR